ncbi:MAG: TRAP transporter small permease [Deferrisomatales bacterium]
MEATARAARHPVVRAVEYLSDLSGYAAGLAILLATLVIVEQVVVRYVLRIPTIWQVEFAVFLLMGATFIGAAYGLKENAHINIDLVVTHAPGRVRRWLDLSTSLISLWFCVYLTWKGAIMWWEAYEGGWKTSSLWSIPLIYPYAILPLGMGLTSLQYLVKIADLVAGMRGRGAAGKGQP